MGQARDEIVALLETVGPLSRRAIGSRTTVQISDVQLAGCLIYLWVEGRIERPTADWPVLFRGYRGRRRCGRDRGAMRHGSALIAVVLVMSASGPGSPFGV